MIHILTQLAQGVPAEIIPGELLVYNTEALQYNGLNLNY
jgi:hypothetical protein